MIRKVRAAARRVVKASGDFDRVVNEAFPKGTRVFFRVGRMTGVDEAVVNLIAYGGERIKITNLRTGKDRWIAVYDIEELAQ